VVTGEVDLEPGDAGQGARRGADFRRKVGKRADVVTEHGGGVRELGAGKLHTVAGVAGEADGDGVEFLNGRLGAAGAGWGGCPRRSKGGGHESLVRNRTL